MKKTEFYNGVKNNVEYLAGLSRESWYKDDGAIVVLTSTRLLSLNCKYNVVTLYLKKHGEKSKTTITDYNKGFKDNMVILTAEAIDKFLTI